MSEVSKLLGLALKLLTALAATFPVAVAARSSTGGGAMVTLDGREQLPLELTLAGPALGGCEVAGEKSSAS